MNKRIFTLFLSILLSGFTFATEIHVSKNGKDTNTGTSSSPFLTIQKAATIATAGDVVVIHEGVYRETVTTSKSGSAGNPITFKAAEGDKVIVSAVEEIKNWTLTSDNIYKAKIKMPLGMERNALFYNENMMDIARWPNNVDNDPYTPDAEYITGGSGSHIEYSGIPAYDWSQGYVWYLGGHSGASWTRKIESYSTSSIEFTAVNIEKWPFGVHNPTVLRNGHRGIFYLFNSLDALDIEREYYYDAANEEVYFKAPNDENPSEGKCEYRAREYTFKLTKNYIVVDGIETFGGILLTTGNNNVIRNSTIRHGIPILDELDNTDAQIGSGAITVEGQNTLIEKNLIEYGTANGISMLASWKGSKNTTIKNNIVRNFNTIGIHAEPIRSNCSGTVIENNTVSGGGRSGIYVSGSNAVIAYNNVFDVMKMNADGGVFYTVGNADYKNSEIHHNWFHNSVAAPHAGYKVAGIYLDNHSKGYKVYNNVVYNVSWAGIQINWDNWDLDIYNNSIYKASDGMGRWENGYTLDDVVITNNYSDKAPWIGTDVQAENIIDENDPFVDATNLNFEPKEGSVLIDAGKEIPGYTDGFVGDAPDIGAYERGGDMWVAGADWIPMVDLPKKNSIKIISAPKSVDVGNSFKVKVEYESTAAHEIVASVLTSSGTKVTEVKKNVAAGKGVMTLDIDQDTDWEAGEGYRVEVVIRQVNDENYFEMDAFSFSVSADEIELVFFQNQGSFRYISTKNPAVLNCEAETVSDTELFQIIDNGDGTVSLKGSNNLYVSSENGLKELTCQSNTIGNMEKFIMEDFGDDIYAFKGNNNLYVRNNMLCTSDEATDWQKFKLNGKDEIISSNEVFEAMDVTIYPNPSEGVFKIKWGQVVQEPKAIIYNLIGQVVFEKTFSSTESISTINLKGEAKGVYLIQLITDAKITAKRIVLE
ncbi:right-handed parallel beta-helix repeat-containing protein [Flammeovirga aprica]|uniref:T9SS type A sorting domain-containing protein n=1 Tax=Flammeovirga aprica JL-4 TaxID=694437 RepID=A0A7X9RZU9_9BACT|nr:right-handed parallel beta-helix repeat-containing protein [Flammeovirga aprica]NME71751.1 T9SS type A sorting domain-containing protein [Flammeovirga aprica JL-4]